MSYHIIFTLAVAVACTSGNPIQTDNSKNSPVEIGPGESGVDNETMNYVERVEKIKRDILLKLGLTKPPSERFSRANIPSAILSNFMLDEDIRRRKNEENDGYTRSRVNIIGKIERYRLCGSKRCLQVRFKNKPFNLNVDSARLWIHVASRQNITRSTIKLYKVAGNRKKLLQISRSRSLRPGWYAMELITKHIIRITSTGESYMDFILEIESENRLFELSKKADVPFLELTTKTKIGKRKRRSAEENCTSKSACCRAEFVINFKDIGWDDWVVSPDKYNAYYCNGHCKNKYNYRHAGILQAATSQLKRKDVKVCCTPYKYSSLKLLYWNEGNMYEKVIDHMIVDECRCP